MSFKIVKGEDAVISFTIRDGLKYPQDITGKTIQCKSRINNALVTFSNPDVVIVNAVQGKVQLKLSDTITEQLRVGFFDFDVYIDPSTTTTRIIKVVSKVPVEDRQR